MTERAARFATAGDSRSHWIEARQVGEPACGRNHSKRGGAIRRDAALACPDCGRNRYECG
jgi:transposase-like protein